MFKVVGKVVYKDGVLFHVCDGRTSKHRVVSEPTLGELIEKGMVMGATTVHKTGSRPFVRLSPGIASKESDDNMPTFEDATSKKEVDRAKKWALAKSDASAPIKSVKETDSANICTDSRASKGGAGSRMGKKSVAGPQAAADTDASWQATLVPYLKRFDLYKYVVDSFDAARDNARRKNIVLNEDGIYVTFKANRGGKKPVFGELVCWVDDEFMEEGVGYICQTVLNAIRKLYGYTDAQLDKKIAADGLIERFTPYDDSDSNDIGFAFTETVVDGLDHPEVYARISKEAVLDVLAEQRVSPVNPDGEVDKESVTEGEIQFIFGADGTTLDEILVFPVYEDPDGFTIGGDYANAPDRFWVYEDAARTEVEKAKKPRESYKGWQPSQVIFDDDGDVVTAKDDCIRVSLVNLDEGINGDYNEEDPDDVNLLRFDVSYRDPSQGINDWEEVDDASYCTNIDANSTKEHLEKVVRKLFNRYRDVYNHIRTGGSVKKMGEELSHIS